MHSSEHNPGDQPKRPPLSQQNITLLASLLVAALVVYALDRVIGSELPLSNQIALFILIVVLVALQVWQHRVTQLASLEALATAESQKAQTENLESEISKLVQELRDKSILLKGLASQLSDLLADEIADLGDSFLYKPSHNNSEPRPKSYGNPRLEALLPNF